MLLLMRPACCAAVPELEGIACWQRKQADCWGRRWARRGSERLLKVVRSNSRACEPPIEGRLCCSALVYCRHVTAWGISAQCPMMPVP